jgi:hypothetical protein
MKLAAIAAVLITLPALVALIFALVTGRHWLAYAAMASLGYNVIPFLVVGTMSRKAGVSDMNEH